MVSFSGTGTKNLFPTGKKNVFCSSVRLSDATSKHEEKAGRAVLTREELGSAAALSVEVDK
jgi:hypothetical protein